MMFSLLLRLQMLKNFVLGCTGRLRQMGLIVIPLLTPLIDPNWINSELAIALVKFFK